MKSKLLLFAILLCVSGSISGVYAQADADQVKKLYEMGMQEQEAEQYYRAIELYKMALQLSPTFVDALRGLAEAYFRLGEYREALKWCVEALAYDKNNLTLKTLEARILIGLGEYEKAEELFHEVLEIEPYNFEAQFGLAELNIVMGRTLEAQIWYEKAMNLQPKNRRAILSLALIYESENKLEQAEELVKLALHHYPSNYMVQYLGGKHYYIRGELAKAEIHTKKALALKRMFPEATLLLSTIYLHQGKFDEVIGTVESLLSDNQNNHLLWYTLGVAYEHTNQIDKCINAYARAFRIRPDDEIARIALENVIIGKFDENNPERLRYAEYHFTKGRALEQRNYYQRALEEYRRGLTLAPFSERGRKLYAEIFKAFGYYEKYLSQLLILENEGFEDRYIQDEIEIYTSLLDDEISDAWGIQQYPMPFTGDNGQKKARLLDQTVNAYSFLLFYDVDAVETIHPLSERNLSWYFYDFLKNEKQIDLLEEMYEYIGFSDAFQKARELNADFFLVFSYRENGRAFSGRCDLYNAATGSEIRSFRVFRTGNDKVKNCNERLSAYINEALPLRGVLLDKEFDTGVINLGKMDGIEEEMEFQILRGDDVIINPETLALSYPDESILGTFTVTGVDELIAEGSIESALFFDLINPGDILIPIIPAEEQEEDGSEATAETKEGEEELQEETERRAGNLDLYSEILKIK